MFDENKIKELYPEAIMYEPMLIHSSTDTQLKNACESEEFFGQLKKDGAFYQFVNTENNCYLFGRTISKKTGLLTEKSENVPHIIEALSALPKDTILVGEIYYPGKTSKDVVSIMGCLPKKAIERQNGKYGQIHYYIHDILMYNGINFITAQTNNDTRYKILKKIFYQYHLDDYDYLELAEAWYDNLYERIGNALSAGEEGMVLKKKTGIYQPGKRPDSNLKAKKVDFIDAIIVGFEEPTVFYYGKEIENWQYWIAVNEDDVEIKLPIGCYYEEKGNTTDGYYKAVTKPYYMGWHNSRINIGAFDKNGRIVNIGTIHSGISDELKMMMSEYPDLYINKVCKIQCMELDKKEKTLRHGFYKGLREDKNPQECTLESIFN